MDPNKKKQFQRWRRKRRLRHRIFGTALRPRMSVSRSLNHIRVQIIDDEQGRTLCAASSDSKELASELKRGGNIDAAKRVGQLLAQRATAAGITSVVFDRNGYRYHGRVRSLADAAREGGLQF
jgi:large subunit ribosomal protein L18